MLFLPRMHNERSVYTVGAYTAGATFEKLFIGAQREGAANTKAACLAGEAIRSFLIC